MPSINRTFWMAPSVSMIDRILILLLLAATLVVSPARAETTAVQTAWRLLDYLAVDYRGAVQDGEVISPTEFAEMTEFAATADAMIAGLPASRAKADLHRQAAGPPTALAHKRREGTRTSAAGRGGGAASRS